jgi:hypothetical protein
MKILAGTLALMLAARASVWAAATAPSAPPLLLDLKRPALEGLTVTVVEGAEPLAWAGTRLAGGDVNGDGIADLVIAAPGGSEDRPSRRGRLYVLYGSLAPAASRIDLTLKRAPPVSAGAPSLLTGGADLVIEGRDDFDHLGASLVVADLDRDGFADIIAGAPRGDGPSNNRPDCGEVAIVYGAATLPRFISLGDLGGLVAPAKPAAPTEGVRTRVIHGRSAGDTLGASLAVGDVNGDHLPDIVAGAPLADGPGGPLGGLDVGEVILVPGAVTPPIIIDVGDPRQSGLISSLKGNNPGDQAGSAVALGDFDGDGLDDIAVGARGADGPVGGMPDAGVVYLVFGSALPGPVLSLGADAAAMIAAPDIGDLMGGSLVFGDLDGDGRADLAIGAELADGSHNAHLDAGEVHLVMGRFREALAALRPPPKPGPARAEVEAKAPGPVLIRLGAPGTAGIMTFYGTDPGDHAGPRAIADLDSDGLPDLVIGVEDASSRRNSRAGGGELRVVFGPLTQGGGAAPYASVATGAREALVYGPTGGVHLGKAALALDLNGDSRPELIVSAPQAGQSLSGKIWILGAIGGDLLRPVDGRDK